MCANAQGLHGFATAADPYIHLTDDELRQKLRSLRAATNKVKRSLATRGFLSDWNPFGHALLAVAVGRAALAARRPNGES